MMIDDNGEAAFIDDNAVTLFVDDNGLLLGGRQMALHCV